MTKKNLHSSGGFLMVPKAGLEPARPERQQILSLLRLPIPPLGQVKELNAQNLNYFTTN